MNFLDICINRYPPILHGLFLLGFYLDDRKMTCLALPLCWIFGSLLTTFEKEETARSYYFLCFLMYYFEQFKMFALFGPLIIASDQGCVVAEFRPEIELFISTFSKLTSAVTFPIRLIEGKTRLGIFLRSEYNAMIRSYKVGHRVTATRLRNVSFMYRPIKSNEKPYILPTNLMELYVEKCQEYRRRLVLTALLLAIWFKGFLALIVGLVTFASHLLIEMQINKVIERKDPLLTRDGVYAIRVHWYNNTLSGGMGVAINEILHVPYHVSRGSCIVCDDGLLLPYYINTNEDLVTYGGPPAFAIVKPGDKVYVNCETKYEEITHEVCYELNHTTGDMTWIGVTKPGESGSPIIVLEDDRILIVGLAGRWMKNWKLQSPVEFFICPRGIDHEEEYSKYDNRYRKKTIDSPYLVRESLTTLDAWERTTSSSRYFE